MPTDKPRFMVTITDQMRNEIENYRFEHRCKSQTQAINELIERGLSVLGNVSDAQKEEPAIGELSEKETEFINVFGALTPGNRRLLLGIAELILQEQEGPAGSQE